ncbi:Elavl1, partial [Symbiodinium necroappetens]
EYLKSLFEEVGRVTHFELWKGPDGQSLGRGKVTYTSTADANMAVKQLSGWYVHGRTMRVCLFRPPSEERGADPGKK